ncbi:hypothetical protein JCM11641_003703 [Rhodosporidiobolus odoratus]
MTVKLYDLVSTTGGRFFSPACVRTRLSLLAKGVPFETVEVTYHDLRFTWKDKLGVEKATAPFIEREDGTLIMDSFEIAKWLDKTYPDRRNLFLPEAPLPVDVESTEYKQAVVDYEAHEQRFRRQDSPVPKLVFSIFARRMVKLFDKETAEYWTSEARLGPGVWKGISSLTPKDEAQALTTIREGLAALSPEYFSDGRLFVSSASQPGMKDFSILGSYRLLRSVSAELAKQTFGSEEVGEWPRWLERMAEAYPLPLYWERDAKE